MCFLSEVSCLPTQVPLTVVDVLPGSEAAGKLRIGNWLKSVNGVDVQPGLSFNEARKTLQTRERPRLGRHNQNESCIQYNMILY